MTDFNHKDARIMKLHRKGLSLAQIARKIGMPNNVERVQQALERHGHENRPNRETSEHA